MVATVKGYRSVGITKDRVNEPERLVTGMVSTVDPDEIGDVMIPSGADCSYLDKHKSVNLYHDQMRPIGTHRSHAIKSNGILVKFRVGTHPQGNEAWTMIQEGVLGALSIEFEGIDYGFPTPSESKQYGQKATRVFREWKLRAYAVVSQPCNADALILETKARVDDWLDRRVRAGKVTTDIAKSMGWGADHPPRLVLIPNGWVLRATP